MPTKSSTADSLLSDFKRQTLEIALNYYEKAKKSDPSIDVLEYWLNCATTIIWASTTMEGFLSDLIAGRYGHQNYQNLIQNHNFGFTQKINFLKTEFTIDVKRNTEWQNIQQTVRNRNDIIHFNNATTNLMTTDNAKNSIQACQDLIKILKAEFRIIKLNQYYEQFLLKLIN